MASIPASAIVQVNPNVLSSGGLQLQLSSVFLTTNPRVPIGSVLPFSSSDNVATFFGSGSAEAALAVNYFLGYSLSQSKPGVLYFYQYNTSAVSAYLRGISVAALTLTQLQALSGTLTFTIDGVAHTTASINLSAASSFSAAAVTIAAALVTAGFTGVTCTYDSVSGAFVVTSSTTGATSTMSLATGTLAAGIGLSTGTLSQGAAITNPTAAMTAIAGVTLNWASFMTVFEPIVTDKLLFAAWANSKNNRFVYIAWDTDVNAIVANNTTCFGAVAKTNTYSGWVAVYQDYHHAAALCGMIASVDFTQTNNRPTFAFKSQSGLISSVTDQTTGDILIANGYNFYGAYATAAQGFNFMYPGQIGGPFQWIDAYINQIWLNQAFQSTLMTLLMSVPSVPYNDFGYHSMIEASLKDNILAAVNYGAIRVGVRPSSTQAVAVNTSAGVNIDQTLFAQGWYLQVKDPGAIARGNRTSPVMNFWYMDGGAVQKINFNSTLLQ